MATLNSVEALDAQIWNGTDWSANQVIDSKIQASITRAFDVVFENNTGRAFVVYGDFHVTNPSYAIWNSTWSLGNNALDVSGPTEWVALNPDIDSNMIYMLVVESTGGNLDIQRWNQTGWDSKFIVVTSSVVTDLAFAMSYDRD